MKLYKLTDRNSMTHGATVWGPGITHTAPGDGELCTAAWIHAYRDPVVAVLMSPAYGELQEPLLWEAEGEVGIDRDMKVGCTSLTTLRQIPLPRVTTEQHIVFAILCAASTCQEFRWLRWATAWLNGTDRSHAAVTTWDVADANTITADVAATAWDAAAAADADIHGDITAAAIRAAWAATDAVIEADAIVRYAHMAMESA